MTPAFHRVTNIPKISSIGSAVSLQITLVTDARMDGLNMALALNYGRPNISLLFETHHGLLLETLERQRSGNRSGERESQK